MKFPQEFIEKVREANNLVDIIGQYVQLRRTGGNFQGLCPFHNEKSPSFSVSEDKQVYHCFGCKASGNVFTFLQNYQGLTFPESIEYLARRAAIPIPELSGEGGGSQAKDIKHTFYKINSLAARFYHEELLRLPESHDVKKYLKARHLNEELVMAYKLGYAPDDWSMLARHLEDKRTPMNAAEQLGIVKRRTGGKSGHYDFFRHRLMFPIFSPAGQCIGFGGRVLSKEQNPKYLNSLDSPVFHKGKVFYGLDHSAKFIRSEDEAIVVEGYMDWLALAKASINNIVATLGTALTTDHAKALKRYTNRALLLFDGDSAGKTAARRSLPILLAEGVHARGLFLPDELDPDEFLQERGEPALRQLIQGAPDLFDLVCAEVWLGHKGSPTGKIQALDEIGPILALTSDPRLRRLYAQNVAVMLDVELRLVEQSVARAANSTGASVPIQKVVRPAAAPVVAPSEGVKFDLTKLPRVELELLNVILMKEVYLKEALAAEVGDKFSHPGARAVFERLAEVYRQMPSKFDTLSALLTGEVKPAESITRHLSEAYTSLSADAATKLLQDCIKRVKENSLRSQSKEMVKKLRGAGPANSTEQLEQIMNVQKTRRSLSRDS
ncbi:MAG: DNA primase [Bdellovibrionales bacterium]|nr:DNA primase [Bdellovibrionales bacterium]